MIVGGGEYLLLQRRWWTSRVVNVWFYTGVVNVWGGERLGWWTSGVVNVWFYTGGGERLGWWTSGVVNVWVVNVLQSKRKWGNLESEFLSTSSFSLHFLFIFSFSLHFLEGRRATQVRDNHNKFRSILNNRKDKHQRYRWEMHITQWRQSTCLRNPWVISVTAHKSCVCVFVTDC